MNKAKLLKQFKKGEIEVSDVLTELTKQGICPALIFDDFGHWAVSSSGMQSIPEEPGVPDDIETRFVITKDEWKKTIKEAVIYYLED